MEDLPQHIVTGIINGSAYGLMGVSFGLIVSVTQRFHFAWATGFAIAGFFAAWLAAIHGVAPLLAVAIALAGAMLFGACAEVLVYRSVDVRWGSNSFLAAFVASFGLAIAAQNLIQLFIPVGNVTLTWLDADPMTIGSVNLTSLDVVLVPVMWACAAATWALLGFTRLGGRIRGVRANPAMAQSIGIDSRRIFVVVFVVASLLAGVVAVFYAMKYAATPDMGLDPFFYAFVVAFIAGPGRSPLWICLVGTALGVAESVSTMVLSVQWSEALVFGVLLAMLVVRAVHAWRPTLGRALVLRKSWE